MIKVIFHLNAIKSFNSLFANVSNIKTKFEEEKEAYQIIALINGIAVTKLLEEEIVNKINRLSNEFITFKVCKNSLDMQSINVSDLSNKIKIVPVGVYELVTKQEQNYRYIKV